MTSREFSSEAIEPLRFVKVGRSVEDDGLTLTLVEAPTTIGTSRWGIIDKLVFQAGDDQRFYQAIYEYGATEMQDYSDFDDNETLDCAEVVPQEVTRTEYVKVDK